MLSLWSMTEEHIGAVSDVNIQENKLLANLHFNMQYLGRTFVLKNIIYIERGGPLLNEWLFLEPVMQK